MERKGKVGKESGEKEKEGKRKKGEGKSFIYLFFILNLTLVMHICVRIHLIFRGHISTEKTTMHRSIRADELNFFREKYVYVDEIVCNEKKKRSE